MTYVLGIDIGGTFTDAVAISDKGDVRATKSSSTPPNYGQGVLNTIDELAGLIGVTAFELLSETETICHGTTATLNALVTGEVADVAFLTTRGHADSIRIMNVEGRYAGLDSEAIQDILQTSKPAPLVTPVRTLEVTERVDAAGEVIVPLDEDALRSELRPMLDDGVEAVAVSLLWSFRNRSHEDRVREIVNELAPDVYVGLSADVSPRIGEYGRDTTTIMSTQVGPRLAGYLRSLEDDLRDRGFRGRLLVMQGSGGAVAASDAMRYAITTVGSVLTGGVVGATTLGGQLGHQNIIATDMGGTTFLVGLVNEGQPINTTRAVIGQHQINLPMVQIHTIGGGGGAIAWIDGGGNLRVGPRSAGAAPGPACYGTGGVEPTITDADVLLGLIDPEAFLGGRMRLDPDLSRDAIRSHIAEPLGLSVEDAAAAIFAIANAQAADAVRQVVVNNGHDPRDFVLYAYGGAAPVHCANYAADLGVKSLLVPLGPTASTFSAFGLAASDVVITVERSVPQNLPAPGATVQAIFDELEQEARTRIDAQELNFLSVEFSRELDLRYSLQLAEVTTPVADGPIDDDAVGKIAADFERRYEQIYGPGTGFSAAGIQAITYRLHAVGRLAAKPELPRLGESAEAPRSKGTRKVHLDGARGWEDAAVYDYTELGTGHELVGPALIEAPATVVVLPGEVRGVVDALGNLNIEFEGV